MARPDSSVQTLLDQQDRLSKRAEDLKRLIISVQSYAQDQAAQSIFLLQEARAAAIVGIVAELEAITRSTVLEVHKHINDAAVPLRALVACLRQLAAHDAFESLRTLQEPAKVWEKRAFATSLDHQGAGTLLPLPRKGALPPMDGRTPNPSLYSRIWAIYGFKGEAFPVASWSASLQKISGLRNDIAHANMPFHEIFQQPGVQVVDIERYIDDLEAFSEHLAVTAVEYIQDEMYLLRPTSVTISASS